MHILRRRNPAYEIADRLRADIDMLSTTKQSFQVELEEVRQEREALNEEAKLGMHPASDR